jgi:hypothetical protein
MSDTALLIPDGWFVTKCDLDADEPYFKIASARFPISQAEKTIPIPKELAYYLRRHWCGSQEMHAKIESNTRREIANKIKDALGMNELADGRAEQ